jgi:hypothetical protein
MEGARSCKIRWKKLEAVRSDGRSQKLFIYQMEGARSCKIRWKEPEAVRSDGRSQKL